MVNFTLNLLGWLLCALFRIFVIAGTSYGIYRFVKDKKEDSDRKKYIKKCQENWDNEYKEAKERISKKAKVSKKEH